MNKFIAIGACILLTGCFQSSASLIGPVYTLGSSGNIYQAGLSYGVNQTIQKADSRQPGSVITCRDSCSNIHE